jgi:uncharacterized protein (TIGR02466 family)
MQPNAMSTITLVRSDALFASPMFLFEIAEADALNKQLLEEVMAMRAQSPGVQKSNAAGWHSKTDFFQRAEPGCAALRAFMVEAIREATLKLSPRFDFNGHETQAHGWFNVNPRGASNKPHSHPGFALSGTYWVKIPPNAPNSSGAFEFIDPRIYTNQEPLDGAACFSRTVTLRPKEGRLLIFPSYLQHSVYPNEQDDDRISMAFNVRYLSRR